MSNKQDFGAAGVIVAHPDDETLWAGGIILMHPGWDWQVFSLCRAGDPDRAPRFEQALRQLGAAGRMGDLDDGPEQRPLADAEVQAALLAAVGGLRFDLLITHGSRGEYTSHRRHVEVFRAVTGLWQAGRISARQLWLFAYDDGNGSYLPRPATGASMRVALPEAVWRDKYRIVREVYGFADDTWEARTTPRIEAFNRFDSPAELTQWLGQSEEPR